jgi:hypothetical protein
MLLLSEIEPLGEGNTTYYVPKLKAISCTKYAATIRAVLHRRWTNDSLYEIAERKKNEEKHLEALEEIKEDGGVRAWLELTPWVTGGTRKKAERDFSAYLGSMNGR